ncbi:MAG: hypothetical protein OXH97_01420 [Chloroflexota bacterium]|nr:hypothetical protein [Chloroflexota bacterium]
MVQTEMLRPIGSEARNIIDSLLKAQTEQDVHRCLDGADLLDDSCWQPYGGVPNNSGAFLNQQASARGALVEKVVNSIDATLMAKAYECGDLPDGPVPQSMLEASERYFNIRAGRLAEITTGQRRMIARENVQVVFSGHKKDQGRPTITVTDQGEGQSPSAFPHTFLSLSATNKMRIPFVQGKFNMGSTGAVPFCGSEHHYQLILSRRHPAAPGSHERWGFTVVRRRSPQADERASQFEYLAPGGQIPEFSADALPIWMSSDGSASDLQHGTLVRLYEYDITERTAANFDFSRMLNRRLYRPPLPIQVVETRKFSRSGNEEIVPGLATRLDEDTSSDVEAGFPAFEHIRIENVGWVRVSLVPFREDVNTDHWVTASESVIFTVNGQAHAFERRDFFRRGGRTGVDYRYLFTNLLVEVDCSELDARTIEQLFMGSRDRMRDNEQRQAILHALAEHLRQHKGLRALNYERRAAAIQRSIESSTNTTEMFEKLIAASPAIAALLSGGLIPAPDPTPAPVPDPFEGLRFPTYLKWARGGPVREKRCALGSHCVLDLETDAANDFLSRSAEPGILDVEPANWVVSENLWNGDLRIRLEPPAGSEPGQQFPIRVTLMSDGPPPEVPEVLSAEGLLTVDPPTPPGPPEPPTPPKPKVAPPDIREVYRDGWSSHGFDERSVALVDKTEGTTTIVFVNMDNRGVANYLRSDVQRRDELAEMYKLAVAPLAISLERAVSDSSIAREEADTALSAIGDVLLPSVDFAAKITQEVE